LAGRTISQVGGVFRALDYWSLAFGHLTCIIMGLSQFGNGFYKENNFPEEVLINYKRLDFSENCVFLNRLLPDEARHFENSGINFWKPENRA